MKFGQFINHTKKYDGETRPTAFSKTKIEHISGSTVKSFIQFIFLVRPRVVLTESEQSM